MGPKPPAGNHRCACTHTWTPSNKRLSPQRMVKKVAYDRKVSWTSSLYSNQHQQKSHPSPVVSARQSGLHVSPAPAPCEHISALGFLCPEVSRIQANSQCLPHSGSVGKSRGELSLHTHLADLNSWCESGFVGSRPCLPRYQGDWMGSLMSTPPSVNKIEQGLESQGLSRFPSPSDHWHELKRTSEELNIHTLTCNKTEWSRVQQVDTAFFFPPLLTWGQLDPEGIWDSSSHMAAKWQCESVTHFPLPRRT